jgi:hypothetical protein
VRIFYIEDQYPVPPVLQFIPNARHGNVKQLSLRGSGIIGLAGAAFNAAKGNSDDPAHQRKNPVRKSV